MISTNPALPLRGENTDIRPVHADLTIEEFGIVRWAAQRTNNPKCGGGISLADFFKLAIMNQVKAACASQVARGKDVPANIAFHVTENTRGLK